MRFDNINRYEVINVINEVLDKTATTSSVVDFANEIMESIALIKGCPLVEVVRCKNCRHRDPEDHKCDSGETERQGCPFKVADDYFCAYGER